MKKYMFKSHKGHLKKKISGPAEDLKKNTYIIILLYEIIKVF